MRKEKNQIKLKQDEDEHINVCLEEFDHNFT